MNELLSTLSKLTRACLVVGIGCWVMVLFQESHAMPRHFSELFGNAAIACSFGFGIFLVLYLILNSVTHRPSPTKSTPAAKESKSEFQDWDSYDDAIRELNRIQNKIEQRVTNLETILLSRTHIDVGREKF